MKERVTDLCRRKGKSSTSFIIDSVLGHEVVGVWPKDAANADVNCSHLSHLGSALATGDDFGTVKLFEFPCTQKYVSIIIHYSSHNSHLEPHVNMRPN